MGIREKVENFAEAFENCELDKVMEYFAPDAVYTSYDGRKCEGLDAIRKEFSGLFNHKFGRLIFHEEYLVVDEAEKKAVLTWTCEHDLSGECSWFLKPVRLITQKNKTWKGLDVFTFDDTGEYVKEKTVYCQSFVPRIKW